MPGPAGRTIPASGSPASRCPCGHRPQRRAHVDPGGTLAPYPGHRHDRISSSPCTAPMMPAPRRIRCSTRPSSRRSRQRTESGSSLACFVQRRQDQEPAARKAELAIVQVTAAMLSCYVVDGTDAKPAASAARSSSILPEWSSASAARSGSYSRSTSISAGCPGARRGRRRPRPGAVRAPLPAA